MKEKRILQDQKELGQCERWVWKGFESRLTSNVIYLCFKI